MNQAKVQWQGIIHEAYISMQETYAKDDFLWRLLVKPFRSTPDDAKLSWKGEFWGKFMRGSSLICAYTQDDELYKLLENSVRDMLSTQDDLGRISTYSVEKEFHGWDLWCRKYVMLGMQFFMEICRDDLLKAQIVEALVKHADYIIERVGYAEGKIPVHETSHIWGGVNSASLLQPIVKLYKQTKQERYLTWAKQLIANQQASGENVFANAFEDKKAPFEYAVTKAYETISCLEGLLEFYEVVGDEKCLQACERFANKVLKTDFTVVGGIGCYDEYFDNSTKKQVVYNGVHKQETCVTVTLCKFLAQLYAHTGKAEYIDAIERAFYNVYLGAYNDGSYIHTEIVPIFYSYSPIYNEQRWLRMGGNQCLSSYSYFGCCIAIGFAGIGILPWVALTEKDGIATLGFYEGGRYALNGEKTMHLRVETGYPYDGKVHIHVEKTENIQALRLRIPSWCDEYTLTKNGEKVSAPAVDGYAQMEVEGGDALVLEMKMPYRITYSKSVNPDVTNLYALQKGPIVLCADSRETDLTASHELCLDEKGYAMGASEDGKVHTLKQVNGETLLLREYKSTSKEYYQLRNVSVWLEK